MQEEQSDEMMADREQRYNQTLRQIDEMRGELQRITNHYNRSVADVKERLASREEKCAEIREGLKSYRRDVAKSAVNPRTGKPMSMKVVDPLVCLLREAAAEAVRRRGRKN